MLATAISVFRALLEAVLIAGIVSTARKDTRRRGPWTRGGTIGIAAISMIGFWTGMVAEAAADIDHGSLAAAILFLAFAVVRHNIRMGRRDREVAYVASNSGHATNGTSVRDAQILNLPVDGSPNTAYARSLRVSSEVIEVHMRALRSLSLRT
jgi:hypothetical protein